MLILVISTNIEGTSFCLAGVPLLHFEDRPHKRTPGTPPAVPNTGGVVCTPTQLQRSELTPFDDHQPVCHPAPAKSHKRLGQTHNYHLSMITIWCATQHQQSPSKHCIKPTFSCSEATSESQQATSPLLGVLLPSCQHASSVVYATCADTWNGTHTRSSKWPRV